MPVDESNLIWIDLEMTGLDVDNDYIIEIATIVTNSNLEILAEGPVFAIHQTDATLQLMDEWNTTQHSLSGLVERVRQSKVDATEAETQTIAFLEQYVPPGASPMCGNTICQDRRFLYKHMPKLQSYFHYRNLDVTTLKILAQRWAPPIAKKMMKESKHLALSDIKDSIDELRYYREHFLKIGNLNS